MDAKEENDGNFRMTRLHKDLLYYTKLNTSNKLYNVNDCMLYPDKIKYSLPNNFYESMICVLT